MVGIYWHEDCIKHQQSGSYHPESPDRLRAIINQFSDSDLSLDWRTPSEASPEQIALAHDRAYVDGIIRAGESGTRVQLDPDTSMDADSLRAARLAAGAVIQAVDDVLADNRKTALCAVRPPGHHAGRANAAGFCLFNNVAIAAYHALENRGLKRVAIIDFDVHHGDGTEDIVAGDERILFCSAFQHPHYPFSGAGDTADNVLNVPLAAGTPADVWRKAVADRWFAPLDNHAPELVLVSAGFDSHRADPLGGFLLEEADYVWITEALVDIAKRHAQGRVLATLEGGYELAALASSVAAHVAALSL